MAAKTTYLPDFSGYPDGGIRNPGYIATTPDGNRWTLVTVDGESMQANIHPTRNGVCGIRWFVTSWSYPSPMEQRAADMLAARTGGLLP